MRVLGGGLKRFIFYFILFFKRAADGGEESTERQTCEREVVESESELKVTGRSRFHPPPLSALSSREADGNF